MAMLSISGLCSQDVALAAMAKQLDKDGASSGFDGSETTKSTDSSDSLDSLSFFFRSSARFAGRRRDLQPQADIPTKNTFIHYDTPTEVAGSPRRNSCPPVPQIIVDRPILTTQRLSLWSDDLKDNGDLVSISGFSTGDESLIDEVPDLLELPSVGSVEHSQGSCRPCAWHWKTEGCVNGSACLYCHLCSRDELKKRKKEKIAKIRITEGKDGEEVSDGSISPKTRKTPFALSAFL